MALHICKNTPHIAQTVQPIVLLQFPSSTVSVNFTLWQSVLQACSASSHPPSLWVVSMSSVVQVLWVCCLVVWGAQNLTTCMPLHNCTLLELHTGSDAHTPSWHCHCKLQACNVPGRHTQLCAFCAAAVLLQCFSAHRSFSRYPCDLVTHLTEGYLSVICQAAVTLCSVHNTTRGCCPF